MTPGSQICRAGWGPPDRSAHPLPAATGHTARSRAYPDPQSPLPASGSLPEHTRTPHCSGTCALRGSGIRVLTPRRGSRPASMLSPLFSRTASSSLARRRSLGPVARARIDAGKSLTGFAAAGRIGTPTLPFFGWQPPVPARHRWRAVIGPTARNRSEGRSLIQRVSLPN